MTKRQYKKHIKKATKLGIVSLELAEMYLQRYKIWEIKNLQKLFY